MLAAYYTRYGTPDVLTVKEVDKPAPKPNEVLVKVRAAGINSWDWDMVRGKPWIVRLWGLTGPRFKIPGADIAGVVESVGNDVTKFKPGDEVFGDLCDCGWGGFAEYACATENALSLKDNTMSFEQAAALPQAGLMGWQALEKAKVKKGQKLLMNGAGGGVGTLVIQMARTIGMEITAVDSSDKLSALQRLGAHHVIDYRSTDFTSQGIQYDLIIDVVASRPASHYARALRPSGSLLIIGGSMSTLFGSIASRRWYSARNGVQLGMLAYRPNEGLTTLVDYFKRGQLKPVIDTVFELHKIVDAFRLFASSSFLGKVIIMIP